MTCCNFLFLLEVFGIDFPCGRCINFWSRERPEDAVLWFIGHFFKVLRSFRNSRLWSGKVHPKWEAYRSMGSKFLSFGVRYVHQLDREHCPGAGVLLFAGSHLPSACRRDTGKKVVEVHEMRTAGAWVVSLLLERVDYLISYRGVVLASQLLYLFSNANSLWTTQKI